MLENAKLKTDIEELKKLLLDKEKRRGGTWSLTPGHDGHFVFFFYCLSFRKTLMLFIFLLSKEGVCMCVSSFTFDVICCSLKSVWFCAISGQIESVFSLELIITRSLWFVL